VWRLLLESGLDIHAMNAVRRRFTRWGGGRLALALAGRAVDVLAISDVPGDDPATIGSGPCAADPLTPADVARLLQDADLLGRLPPAIAGMLRDAPDAVVTTTPGHAALARVRTRIIASNGDAVRGAAARARELGWETRIVSEPLTGPAAAAGARVAAALLLGGGTGEASPAAPRCLIAGGETTVALGDAAGCGGSAAPAGGRCQELALAAARVLAGAGTGGGTALLAAGTDGRDGPTDAAGAVVDGHTWHAVRAAGRDPAADLVCHESYAALGATGALLRTGPTGTNVMDVVIGVRRTD
jgi:glycerate-2-kinase